MTNKLSTNVVKINFKMIIDNVTNKEFWKRRWKIFEYDGIEIIVYLRGIDISDNDLTLVVRVQDNNEVLNEYNRSSTEFIFLPLDNYNPTVFQRRLLSRAHSGVRELERGYARVTDRYDELESERLDKVTEHRNMLVETLNNEGVTHEDIRESYLSRYSKSFYDDINEYVESFEDTALEAVHNMIDVMIAVEDDTGR